MWSISKDQGNPEMESKTFWWRRHLKWFLSDRQEPLGLGNACPTALCLCTFCFDVKLWAKKKKQLFTFVLGSYHTASSFHALFFSRVDCHPSPYVALSSRKFSLIAPSFPRKGIGCPLLWVPRKLCTLLIVMDLQTTPYLYVLLPQTVNSTS